MDPRQWLRDELVDRVVAYQKVLIKIASGSRMIPGAPMPALNYWIECEHLARDVLDETRQLLTGEVE